MTVREKLCELYPDGLVLGACYGVIGNLGLTVQWSNENATQQEVFKEDEEVPIIKHELHKVEIIARGKKAVIPTTFLKGLKLTQTPNHDKHDSGK